MTTSTSSSLRFFVPATLTKSSKGGKQVMKVSGVASTTAIDSDGEILDPRGFDLSSFNFINWNHSKDPKHYIGEPVKYEITRRGLELEGELFENNEFAKDVYNLGQSLKNSKKGTKLGWSVEGKVLERDPLDPRKVTKAKITAVAICPFPKNGDTFVDFLKGHTHQPEFEEDIILGENASYTITKNGDIVKSDTQSSEALIGESLEGVSKKKKKRGLVMMELIKTTGSIEKASQVFSLVQAISDKNNSVMSKTEFLAEDIEKAFSTLGLDYSQYQHLDLSKGEGSANGGSMTYPQVLELAKGLHGENCSRGDAASKLIEKGCPSTMAKKAIDETYGEEEDEDGKLEKSIVDLNLHMNSLMESNQVIQKSILDKLDTIISKNESLEKENNDLKQRLEQIEKSDLGPRSIGARTYIPTPGEEFQKSQDGKTVLSITANKQRILDTLDSGINYDELQKSENQTLAKSMETFEISGILDRRGQEFLQSKNITITK